VQIMLEAVSLTLLAGLLGMLAGTFVLEVMANIGIEGDFFKPAGADLTVASVALFVLVVCGLLAGLLPAIRALQIKAVDALRTE